jgi:hypothetical protein
MPVVPCRWVAALSCDVCNACGWDELNNQATGRDVKLDDLLTINIIDLRDMHDLRISLVHRGFSQSINLIQVIALARYFPLRSVNARR